MVKEMTWDIYKRRLLRQPGFQKALKEIEPEYQIARALIKARIERGLTQAEIAKRMGTKQSVISRVERANTVPSLSFLKRLAQALDTELQIQFT
ncbi:transcriptional regulator [Candidatus Roizmanbacteria bacterium CG10_big_fil_rev_8_21_14_0_10_45_7]|uniref:Transcriptional regulator n=1 Tax=Candidatus Roizmanbacteria bacterium CG10_big_fil_rev_8_21_14_0_10_45_7 TaxID=1974854 RepID=A0A2M8KVF0_9BACT|nr:MAG: transcriptional regulator [Candidatus Roizmanbacteria bacterium CG10_big_fil_rev_8_21_14_0_10_45_7]